MLTAAATGLRGSHCAEPRRICLRQTHVTKAVSKGDLVGSPEPPRLLLKAGFLLRFEHCPGPFLPGIFGSSVWEEGCFSRLSHTY
jgi:hypothetical protein